MKAEAYARRTAPQKRKETAVLKKIVLGVFLILVMAVPATAQHHGHNGPHAQRGQNFTPVPNDLLKHLLNGGHGTEQEKCVDKPGLVRGQEGYQHCRDHKAFQKVFTTGNCYCSVGQCREADWRADPNSPSGVSFEIVDKSGKVHWCPVKSFIDPRKVKIPVELDGPGYICFEENSVRYDGCPPVELTNCAIRRDGV